ncbi:hypothetical protein L211DRAFT_847041 [Terfezia boudieri ATCC MYA-4762]|uniref:Fungal N-terminal domain-containing protein n=1 Tax=Terfezia boudieri ATCC MYA-4762 TaxID=1051890 RepID=A0A3N4LYZ7_9PEZI|nr:hypothetical protein L211DRAFT_847041 [Terfezia boudieri ATCC MYA-4762]
MTDPLSITASIASIAAACVQVIVLAEGFISDCKNAPSEFLKLTSEMQAMGTALGRLAEFSHSPGLDDLLPQQLVDDLRPILESCMLLFERTERIVGKLNKGMLARSVLARLRWVVKEKELEKLRIGISEHKLSLNMTLAVASCIANHRVHASTTRLEAHNEEILKKLNQLLSQVPELQTVCGNSTASSLIIRRFLDDITSYAGSVCNSSRPSSVIMRRYMNGVPYTESTVATPRASFDQHNESGDLNAGMLEPPVELNPSYMTHEIGDIEYWRHINEMKTNLAMGSVSDSFLLRRRSQRGLDDSTARTKRFPRRKPVSPLSPAFSASGTSIQSAGRWDAAYDKRSTDDKTPETKQFPRRKPVSPFSPASPASGPSTPSAGRRNPAYDEHGLDNMIPGTKKLPRQKPVSPLSPGFSSRRWYPAYDELGSQLPKFADPALPPTPDSGVYTADDTPILTKRTSYDQEREALERLVLTNPRHMHWLRVMLDRSDENILLDSTKAVESVVRSAIEGSTDRIIRIHERKIPIIKIPVPLRELATDDSMPAHLVRNNALIVEAPTHGASAASPGGNTQQLSSRLTIPARVQPPSQKNLTQTPQQEVTIVQLSPTESWCLPQGWEFGGSCSPNRSSRSDH